MLVGVDIGGTKTAVVIAENPTHILSREEFPTLPSLGPDHAIEKIQRLIDVGLSRHGQPAAFRIGVSCGGPLDRVNGTIQSPPNLASWANVPIKEILERKFTVPCLLENDANAGAVAEYRYGAGVGCRNMVFLTLVTGFGAGLILNRELYRGTSEMAGEIGHVRLTDEGPVGYGKAGSVEGWVSGWGMAQHGAQVVESAIRAGEFSSLIEIAAQREITSRDIGEAALSGDGLARRIVCVAGQKLGLALAMLVTSAANVLLLDEPTNNLDPVSREQVLDALRTYAGAIILVTHDEGAVEALSPDKVILLPDGVEDSWSTDLVDLVSLA